MTSNPNSGRGRAERLALLCLVCCVLCSVSSGVIAWMAWRNGERAVERAMWASIHAKEAHEQAVAFYRSLR